MGRGRTRDVGGLAFVCSTSAVRRSTPRALRVSSSPHHLRRLREFEREMMLERQREGIAKAKAENRDKRRAHRDKLPHDEAAL